MSAPEVHSIVLVSDLHLSAGPDGSTDWPGADDLFPLFLEHLQRLSAEESRTWRLVLLGDVLDFLRIEPSARVEPGALAEAGADSEPRPSSGSRLDTSERAALLKLDWLATCCPAFFASLGRFVDAGSRIVVVPGNHDIELMRSSAQRRFAELVLRSSSEAAAAERVAFAPWIYYVPGVLYAEHGHQYHDINAFPTLLRPYAPDDPQQLDLPLGSYLEVCLSSFRRAMYPEQDNRKSPRRRSPRAFPAGNWTLFASLGRLVYCISALLGGARSSLAAGRAPQRLAYRSEVLPAYAAELGFPFQTVAALDQLSSPVSAATLRRLLQKLTSRAYARAIESNYLYQAARRIRDLLETEGLGVPYYVFGHTHSPVRYPLASDPLSPLYLNCGGRGSAEGPGSSARAGGFSFVEILSEPSASRVTARLCHWDGENSRNAAQAAVTI